MQTQTSPAGRPRSEWAEQLMRENERMRAVPGIGFIDSASGRTPCLKGTGIKVHVVIRMLREFEWDELALAKAFSWLTWDQLDAAIRYYHAYKAEVDARIAEDDSWTVERVKQLNEEIRAIRQAHETEGRGAS